MSFLSCEEMLAAARSQKIPLAEAVLRSDLAESRLTEVHSRAAMQHLWQVMQATSRSTTPPSAAAAAFPAAMPPRWSRPMQQGQQLGGDYLCRSDSRSPQDRRVQRLHEAHRSCAHGGQLRCAACGAAAAGARAARQTRMPSAMRSMWPQASGRSSPPVPRWRAQRAAVRPRWALPAPWPPPPSVT